MESFEQIAELLSELVEKYPDNPQFARDLAFMLRPLAETSTRGRKCQRGAGQSNDGARIADAARRRLPKDAGIRGRIDESSEALKKLKN